MRRRDKRRGAVVRRVLSHPIADPGLPLQVIASGRVEPFGLVVPLESIAVVRSAKALAERGDRL